MKLRALFLVLVLATANLSSPVAVAGDLGAIPAFPGAEGAGAFSTGGRGGRVIEVRSLADDGPGSLREAAQATGPRIVVFRVSGIIDLRSDLVVTEPRLTIAGQTAPGDGICLKRYPLRIAGTHDVVVRHLRVRVGDEQKQPFDGIEIRDSRRVIVDHCSVSWSIDEGINTWHGAREVTVQWCIIAEPLNRSVHYGPHAYGATWGGQDVSFHHNLFAHCTARNPSVGGNHEHRTVRMDHRCSVIYNWEHRTCDGKPESINVVNNYYKPGPATQPAVRRRVVRIDDTRAKYGYDSRWHIEGNMIEGEPDLNEDNWAGVEMETPRIDPAVARAREPFPVAAVTTEDAAEAYVRVLDGAGATRPRRDVLDQRYVQEVRDGTASFGNGIIDSQAAVGGWPEYRSEDAPLDSDADGMPDSWEISHGFSPNNPADGPLDADGDGYTNVEEWLNRSVPLTLVDFTRVDNTINPL